MKLSWRRRWVRGMGSGCEKGSMYMFVSVGRRVVGDSGRWGGGAV